MSHKTQIISKSIDMGSTPTFNIIPQSLAESASQMASNILNALEDQLPLKPETNDYGMFWDEEGNTNLFEELEGFEFQQDVSSASNNQTILAKIAEEQHQLTEYSVVNLLTGEPVTELEPSSADVSSVNAEFQAILESLRKESSADTDTLGQVFQYAGIPTTFIDGEALVPVEVDGTCGLTGIDMEKMDIELDDINVNVISEDDIEIIDESEILDLGSISNHGSPASSVYSVQQYERLDEDDYHTDAAGHIIDALLNGDLSTAQSFLPAIHNDDSSMCSVSSNGSTNSSVACIEDVTIPKPSTTIPAGVNKKPERRGRKPGKKLAKGSIEYIKDKSIRKKEQNKTAATRYRQKKKMEVAVILDSESELQIQHDELVKSKDDIWKQVLMVRQLLREVIQARKPKPSTPIQGKPISVRGGAIPVPTKIVGKNRRK